MLSVVPRGRAAVPADGSAFLARAEVVSAALQVDHMTQHMETSERSMQYRIQRLETIRMALEEVRTGAPVALGCLGSGGRRKLPGELCGVFIAHLRKDRRVL